jgi:hypothetical protein
VNTTSGKCSYRRRVGSWCNLCTGISSAPPKRGANLGREGFLAANAERFRRDEAQAYGEEDFEELDRFLERLRAIIRDA